MNRYEASKNLKELRYTVNSSTCDSYTKTHTSQLIDKVIANLNENQKGKTRAYISSSNGKVKLHADIDKESIPTLKTLETCGILSILSLGE